FQLSSIALAMGSVLDTAKARPFGVMFTRPKNYEWINVPSQEFVEEVFEVAKGLIQSGVELE
ncbi:hypothetical protein, partial [Citrobacter youngae]|uniref:hypothetical protein n=1 Tax=Citrobacter youngae TaxID=133448 RepID=UPI0019549016